MGSNRIDDVMPGKNGVRLLRMTWEWSVNERRQVMAEQLIGQLTIDDVLKTTRSVRKRLDFTKPVPRQMIEECIAAA